MRVEINHEAWIEDAGDKLLVRWGHYPRTDGRLDPHLVVLTLARVDGRWMAGLPLVHEEDALSIRKQGRLEALMVYYRRGPFSKTKSGLWVYGDGYSVEELLEPIERSLVIHGYAVYATSLDLLDVLPLPLRPEIVLKDDTPMVNGAFFMGERVEPLEAKAHCMDTGCTHVLAVVKHDVGRGGLVTRFVTVATVRMRQA